MKTMYRMIAITSGILMEKVTSGVIMRKNIQMLGKKNFLEFGITHIIY